MLQYRRSGARTVMPYALSTLAAATLFLAVGPVNAAANFSGSVAVASAQTCTLTVAAPSYSAFTAKWTKAGASASTIAATNSASPSYIKFSYGRPDCAQEKTYVSAEVTGGAVVEPSTSVIAVRAPTTNGAFWRFTPVVAAATLYANADYTSPAQRVDMGVPGDGSWQGFRTTAQHRQGTVYGRTLGSATINGIEMTDDFGADADNWPVPLIAKGTLTGRTDMHAGIHPGWPSNKAASGQLGIGMVVDTDPINTAGEHAPDAVTDGTTVSVSFVVSLSSE